ncbi:hypothetical protein CVT26_007109, partial [Gymnopilus dilepis]
LSLYLIHSLLTLSFSFSLDSTPPLPWGCLRPPRYAKARRGQSFFPSSTTASTPPPSRGRASRGTRAGGAVGTRTPPSNALSPAPSPTSLASKSESEVAILPSFCQRAWSPPRHCCPHPLGLSPQAERVGCLPGIMPASPLPL